MINKISFNIPCYKGKNSQRKQNVTYKRENYMSENNYNNINADFNSEKSLKIISDRRKTMPAMMDRIFGIITGYLSKFLTKNNFTKMYQDEVVPLYKRIELGTNKEAFAESYKHEISAMHSISEITDKYSKKSISDNEFDNQLEKVINKYTNSEVERTKYFTA